MTSEYWMLMPTPFCTLLQPLSSKSSKPKGKSVLKGLLGVSGALVNAADTIAVQPVTLNVADKPAGPPVTCCTTGGIAGTAKRVDPLVYLSLAVTSMDGSELTGIVPVITPVDASIAQLAAREAKFASVEVSDDA